MLEGGGLMVGWGFGRGDMVGILCEDIEDLEDGLLKRIFAGI